MVMSKMKELLGDPRETLAQVAEISKMLSQLDPYKMKQLRAIIEGMAQLKGSPQELNAVMEIVRFICCTSPEHLSAVRDITTNLVKLAHMLPKDGLANLPFKDIIGEFRKGG